MGGKISLEVAAEHKTANNKHYVLGIIRISGVESHDKLPTSPIGVYLVGTEKAVVIQRRGKGSTTVKDTRPFFNMKRILTDPPKPTSDGKFYTTTFQFKLPNHIPKSGRSRGFRTQGVDLGYHVLVEFQQDKSISAECKFEITDSPPYTNQEATTGTIACGGHQLRYKIPNVIGRREQLPICLASSNGLPISNAKLFLYEYYTMKAYGSAAADKELLYELKDQAIGTTLDEPVALIPVAQSANDSFTGNITTITHSIVIEVMGERTKIPICIHSTGGEAL